MFYFALKMRWPGVFHEQPHYEGGRCREAGLIEQPYGNKAEDQRMSSPPEPDVLVKHIENYDDNDQQFFGHSYAYLNFKLGST